MLDVPTAIMRGSVLLIVVLMVASCGPSTADAAVATDECKKFISKEMRVSLENTAVLDVWKKRGSIVVEVGYKERRHDDSYSVRLCVVDMAKGELMLPSVFNQSEWGK